MCVAFGNQFASAECARGDTIEPSLLAETISVGIAMYGASRTLSNFMKLEQPRTIERKV